VLLGEKSDVEVKGASFLYTFVVVTITAGGFFGLLLGIRRAVGARPSLLEGYLAKTALTQVFALSGGALLPPIVGLYDVSESWLWRIAAVCFGIPRKRSTTSRIRGFCRFGKCDNRGDVDLRHRWL
jgi:hypothetical protein